MFTMVKYHGWQKSFSETYLNNKEVYLELLTSTQTGQLHTCQVLAPSCFELGHLS